MVYALPCFGVHVYFGETDNNRLNGAEQRLKNETIENQGKVAMNR